MVAGMVPLEKTPMGMGYGAAYADVIENDRLEKLFPAEFKALDNALKGIGKGLPELASAIESEEIDEENEAAASLKALETLQEAFAAKYAGLSLKLGFHDPEQGDRYDDVSGAFFSVNGLYVLSEGAKQLGETNFDRKFFVNFG